GAADGLQKFQPESSAIFERAPVFVGATVEEVGKSLGRKGARRTVDVDDVESSGQRALCRLYIHSYDPREVFLFRLKGVAVRDGGRLHLMHGRLDIAG